MEEFIKKTFRKLNLSSSTEFPYYRYSLTQVSNTTQRRRDAQPYRIIYSKEHNHNIYQSQFSYKCKYVHHLKFLSVDNSEQKEHMLVCSPKSSRRACLHCKSELVKF